MTTEEKHRVAFESMHGPGAWDRLQQLQASETAAVHALCERLGYGRVLHDAARLWKEKDPMGAHTAGPCVGATVACECQTSMCDWCCGAGWLTKRVKQAKDAAGE